MKFKWRQGIVALAATSALSFAFASVSGASDVKEKLPSWATTEIEAWKDMGLLKGDAQGNLLPNNAVTRAEFIAIINRVFNYPEQGVMSFKDVPRTAWYAADFDKAVAAGALIGGSGGEMSPLRSVTREEAAVILSRVFHVAAAREVGSLFKDDVQIANWSKEAVYALKASGYVAGRPDGSFQPKKALTRAEAVKMIDNAMGILVADGQDHARLSGGNLVVNTAGGIVQPRLDRQFVYYSRGRRWRSEDREGQDWRDDLCQRGRRKQHNDNRHSGCGNCDQQEAIPCPGRIRRNESSPASNSAIRRNIGQSNVGRNPSGDSKFRAARGVCI